MMTNLFSVFDPSSSILSMSWMVVFLIILFIPNSFMKLNNSCVKMISILIMSFKKEVSFTLKKSEKSTELMIMLVFVLIISLNVIALYPQTFSPTSHLVVTLPLSLLFWLTVTMFGWLKNTNHMLSHLLPQGTPTPLMMFMVLIELTSTMIRPVTLCVRLTANLIAGHLLMSLLGNALMTISTYSLVFGSISPLILTILETAVACIQAYVLMTLITLYTMEVK